MPQIAHIRLNTRSIGACKMKMVSLKACVLLCRCKLSPI